MKRAKIAVISFPGNNCEVESMRSIKEAGMDAVYFRWNDEVRKLANVDGYFIPGGFSYEDRGRSGMIAGRDPLMEFIKDEAAKGKPVIGNCNGAQILVESGLIPNGEHLDMSLARNALKGASTGFLSEWVWITPSCSRSRCATSDWEGVMHVPIAHGEGRFTTKDGALWKQLMDNDQLAFTYCDEDGKAAHTAEYNPNGSEFSAAGICNPEGNVVALMPHPERTPNGASYFQSLRRWIETHAIRSSGSRLAATKPSTVTLPKRGPKELEIFIDTVIVNNEERTVEKALRRAVPSITLKQMKYLSVPGGDASALLSMLSLFNPNKEIAYVRRSGTWYTWDASAKKETVQDALHEGSLKVLRRDEPDTGGMGQGSESGVCYFCGDVDMGSLLKSDVLALFGNPHSSTLEMLA